MTTGEYDKIYNDLKISQMNANATYTSQRKRIAELEEKAKLWEQLYESAAYRLNQYEDVKAIRFFANESLAKRNAELETENAEIKERIKWVLTACEIDRDARHELESLLTEGEASK